MEERVPGPGACCQDRAARDRAYPAEVEIARVPTPRTAKDETDAPPRPRTRDRATSRRQPTPGTPHNAEPFKGATGPPDDREDATVSGWTWLAIWLATPFVLAALWITTIEITRAITRHRNGRRG